MTPEVLVIGWLESVLNCDGVHEDVPSESGFIQDASRFEEGRGRPAEAG